MSGNVQLDETGLHARDCQCLRCETGYRPTETERYRAAEALRIRRERQDALAHETPAARRKRLAREALETARRAELARQLAEWNATEKLTAAELAAIKEEYRREHPESRLFRDPNQRRKAS